MRWNVIPQKRIPFFSLAKLYYKKRVLQFEFDELKIYGNLFFLIKYLHNILNFSSFTTKPKIFTISPFRENLRVLLWGTDWKLEWMGKVDVFFSLLDPKKVLSKIIPIYKSHNRVWKQHSPKFSGKTFNLRSKISKSKKI